MPQQTSPPEMAIVALTHGQPSAANRAAVIQLVDAVSAGLPEVAATIRFVDAQRPDSALNELIRSTSGPLVIVPFVLSAGFHLRARLLTLLADVVETGRVVIAEPLAPDERIVDALIARLREVELRPDDAVVIAAAGSSNTRAIKECAETARLLGQRLGIPATVGYVAAASPRLGDALEMVRAVHPGARTVLGSYLLAPGSFYDSVKQAGADVVSAPLLLADQPPNHGLVELVQERYLQAAQLVSDVERTAESLGGRATSP